MKPFRNTVTHSKPVAVGITAQRKPSIGGLGKENINLTNYQMRPSEKRQQNKESSPKDSGNRGTLSTVNGTFLTGRGAHKQDRIIHQKGSGSQDRNSIQDQRERSCTPGSIKKFMNKVRMQSFHLSPKENFKVNFKGKALRMGSPKTHKNKYVFDTSRIDGNPVNSSSPKSRQIASEFFNTENQKILNLEGHIVTKDTIKESMLSQGTYNYNQGSQDKPMASGKVKSTGTCVNHPLKKSKFYLTDLDKFGFTEGENTFYSGVCSKCAVRLASSGHNIEEIYPGDDELKKKTFSQLIQRISTVMNLVKLTKEHINTREEKAFSFYKGQLENLKEVQNHIDRIFANFIRTSELVKKSLAEEHQRQVAQCNEFKSQLSRKEVELQNLAKHLTEYRTNAEMLSDLTNLDMNIGRFNEALTATVEDCKALHGMKLTLSKLSPGIQVLAPQVESKLQDLLKLRHSDLLFQLPTIDKYTKQLSIWADISKPIKSCLITESSVDTTSWNEYNQNKAGGLSFDRRLHNESKTDRNSHSDHSSEKESPTKYYKTILQRIDDNQAETMKFYSQALADESEHLFKVDAQSQAFNQQQTPELGVKEQAPAYLKEQLSLLQSNYEQSSLQKRQSTKLALKGEQMAGWSQEKTMKSESSQQTNFTEVREFFLSQTTGSLLQSDGQASLCPKK